MNLSEIQHAIETLPQDQQVALVSWITERDRAIWDAELERDFAPVGAGMKWLRNVKAQVHEDKSRPISGGPPQP